MLIFFQIFLFFIEINHLETFENICQYLFLRCSSFFKDIDILDILCELDSNGIIDLINFDKFRLPKLIQSLSFLK